MNRNSILLKMAMTMVLALGASLASAESSTTTTANTSSTTATGTHQNFKNQSVSLYNYMPTADTGRLVVAPKVTATEFKSKSNFGGQNYSKTTSGTFLDLTYTQAFENISLSAHTDIGNKKHSVKNWGSTQSQDYNFGGFSNFVFSFKGLSQSGSEGNIIYGSELSLSPAKAKLATQSENGNRYSGGHSLSPFAGFESSTNFGAAGAVIKYDLMGERSAEAPDYSSTTTGGNTLSLTAFTEGQFSSNKIGGSLTWEKSESEEMKKFEDGFKSQFSSDPETHLEARLYGRFQILPDIEFLPSLSYNTQLDKDINNQEIEKYEQMNLNLGFSSEF